jgi:uncharacterized protein YprB with RNaseH-like and TPR domain
MLRHTFCHLPGVGPKTEQSLWRSGVLSWEDALAQCPTSRHIAGRNWPEHLAESLHHFDMGNPTYFASNLAANQAWRLFKDFRGRCAYLDIETTGLGGYGDHITTIALFDGQRLRTYVHGANLDDFCRDFRDYSLVITYNGTSFDLPFLERQFRVHFGQAHIDLRYVLRSLGLTGGLKRCEQLAGIRRPGLEDVDGYTAVLLWHEYRRHRDSKALETLLAYNAQDTLNLEQLMVMAFNRKIQDTPFAELHRLPEPERFANPFVPDPNLVQRLVRGMSWQLAFRY